MGRVLRRLTAIPFAVVLALAPATAASASHDPRYFSGAGATEQQAIDGARANMADYERQQGVDCAERSAFAQWNWEYEYWEGYVTADCPPDSLEDRYFSGAGATEQQAIDGARANMADYEREQGVDCVEESAFAQWNWEYEYWEGTVHAVCDFGS